MEAQISLRNSRYCAFCQYWWDPTFKFIRPYIGDRWYYKSSGKCRCIKKGIDMSATQTCSSYRCKVEW